MAFSFHAPRFTDGNYCVYPSDMRTWEKTEIDEIPERGRELMEIAGREVAMYAIHRYPDTAEALIFCGPGNNGGDALVAAYYLERSGIQIHIFAFDEEVVKTPDAKYMFERVCSFSRTILKENSDVGAILEWTRRRNVIVIDGIYGTGYKPSHNGLMSRVYQCIMELSCPVISIDIPSGIDANTGFRGSIQDEAPPRALKATDTITFGAPKFGHFFGDGSSHCGELHCVDIGLRPWPGKGIRSLILSDTWCQSHLWKDFSRSQDTHKGKCGHVVVIGGDATMPGASCLAARAALRAGCGLATIAAKVPMRAPDEIMVSGILNEEGKLALDRLDDLLERADCIVLGPGLGRDDNTLAILEHCALKSKRMILDADGLWALAKLKMQFKNCEMYATPHPGEAAALCDASSRDILFNPIEHARQIAENYGVTAILKFHTTVIASKRAGHFRFGLLPYPNPAIASAGSGDVLSGILAGILAQSRAGAVSRWFDAFEVAAMAVHAHSLAGRKAAQIHGNSLMASNIIEQCGMQN